jgi:hypothetical protein
MFKSDPRDDRRRIFAESVTVDQIVDQLGAVVTVLPCETAMSSVIVAYTSALLTEYTSAL